MKTHRLHVSETCFLFCTHSVHTHTTHCTKTLVEVLNWTYDNSELKFFSWPRPLSWEDSQTMSHNKTNTTIWHLVYWFADFCNINFQCYAQMHAWNWTQRGGMMYCRTWCREGTLMRPGQGMCGQDRLGSAFVHQRDVAWLQGWKHVQPLSSQPMVAQSCATQKFASLFYFKSKSSYHYIRELDNESVNIPLRTQTNVSSLTYDRTSYKGKLVNRTNALYMSQHFHGLHLDFPSTS